MTSELRFAGGGRERTLQLVRRRGARSLRLSVDPRDGGVRLTLPPREPLGHALAWAAGKRNWVEDELAKLPAAQPVVPGMTFDLLGEPVVLDWGASHPRTVRREDGLIRIGGPMESLTPRLLRWLRAEAQRVLDAETRSLCFAHGLAVSQVGVGDPRGRWGSCASGGRIRYSWRLILSPPDVMRATVAHEVAHLVHMDHSPAFHAEAARLFGRAPTAERLWLRAHGTRLHWFGRES